MSGRLVPFIPDGYIDSEMLSEQCIDDLKEEISSFIPPIGFVYTQYYGCLAPWQIFPDVIESSWESLYNTEGLFFCTEGGESNSFNGTIKNDQMQGHHHYSISFGGVKLAWLLNVLSTGVTSGIGIGGATSNIELGDPSSDGANGTPRIGLTTRPKSVTIRVWKRIS